MFHAILSVAEQSAGYLTLLRATSGSGRADFIKANVTKPVVGYVAGFTAPEGKTMGHAGAIVSGSSCSARPWYVEAATGMGQTLQIASEKNAYTITDRSTYLSQQSHLRLDILNGGDPPLLNYYHVITVSPTKFPKVNAAGANAFADYLVHPDTQKLIASFGLDKFGQQLFFPDAGKPDPSG